MNVLITGAAGGLGRAFVNECARRKYKVCATDINVEGLLRIKNGIKNRYDVGILTHQCDITDMDSINDLLNDLKHDKFDLDMLINVAGIDHEGAFLEKEFHKIQHIIQLNILGTLRITHSVLNVIPESRRLQIINVASLAAEQPIPLKATYAASKRFLLDFSRALREEVKHRNVSVLALCPAGLTTNEEVMKAIAGQGFFGAITTVKMERMVSKAIDLSWKGKSKYIPGTFNKITSIINHIAPIDFITKMLYKRWKKAQATWLNKK